MGVPEKLVENLGTIWGAMASGFAIDLDKFELLCQETKVLYFSSVGWYAMPSTLHKILEHGRQIIEECPVPLGLTNEEASESNNKVLRGFRLHHSRRTSWRHGVQDLFNRLMDVSDPIIQEATSKSSARKQKPLSPAILALLKAPELVATWDEQENQSEGTDDSSDETEVNQFKVPFLQGQYHQK